MKLVIPKDIYDSMVRHCVDGLPNEACGFLAGKDATVSHIYGLTNAASSPVYYRPADKELLAAMDHIDANDLELAAIFHSHVASAPYPSPTDVREAHYPGVVYLIVSLVNSHDPEARGYLINKRDWRDEAGEIEPVDLMVS